MKTGRNEICPCGSGKKFKHCCMLAIEPPSKAIIKWKKIRILCKDLPAKVFKYINNKYGLKLIDEGWFSFIGDDEPFDVNTPHIETFTPWFFYIWRPNQSMKMGGKEMDKPLNLFEADSVIEDYIENTNTDPLLGEYLLQCTRSPFSFYDVLTINYDVGLTLREFFTGEEFFVFDQSLSRQAKPGAFLFLQLVKWQDICLFEGYSKYSISYSDKASLFALREHIEKSTRNKTLTIDNLLYFQFDIFDHYFDIVEKILTPPVQKIANTDGDPFQLITLIYAIDSPDKAFDALSILCLTATKEELINDAQFDQAGRLLSIDFPWQKMGNVAHKNWDNTIMGEVNINDKTLKINVNSENRALLIQSIISERLPSAKMMERQSQSIDELRENQSQTKDSGRESREELMKNPEVRAMLSQQMQSFYRDWLDTPIPMLKNKTPRQAVKTRDGREMVEALLIETENSQPFREIIEEPAALMLEMRQSLGLLK